MMDQKSVIKGYRLPYFLKAILDYVPIEYQINALGELALKYVNTPEGKVMLKEFIKNIKIRYEIGNEKTLFSAIKAINRSGSYNEASLDRILNRTPPEYHKILTKIFAERKKVIKNLEGIINEKDKK